ncbi:MAG: hypothetical protein LAO05_06225 [Acidobacteriia bacterium]|nr:hypothetical protein [Terriglobia bacterium]
MGLSIVWLVFAVVFLGLGVRHWRDRQAALPELKSMIRPSHLLGVPTVYGGKEFVDEVNEFVRRLNARLSSANRLAAFGYFAASATALVSAVLAWFKSPAPC